MTRDTHKRAVAAWNRRPGNTGEIDEAGWRDIASDPPMKVGTVADLWIEGADDTVDFYAPLAGKVKGKPLRAGRTTEWVWDQRGPNKPNWYALGGLSSMPISPDVTVTHWMPLPAPPALDAIAFRKGMKT